MNALITPDQAIKRYGDAQGNILKGHGRENVALLFIRFGDSAKARQWIDQLVEQNDPTLPRIVSTEQQLREREERQQDYSFDAGLFATLSFTAAGLGFLEVPAGQMPQEAVNQASFGRNGAFAAGMRAEATRRNLHDPDPADWDPGWWASDTEPSALHALLLLADANAARLQQAVAAVKKLLPSFEIRLVVQENGKRLFHQKNEKQENEKKEKQDIEHFGYADGVSQPIYLTDDDGAEKHERDKELGPEDLVLAPDSLSRQPDAWGSFFVFRKLAQKVPEFKDAEEALAKELQLLATEEKQAGAMLVGRFKDGTPVVMQSHDGQPTVTNNFDYTDDTGGLKCPFHAHIRKMNPRGETNEATELRHRITRRGIPYGSQDDAQQGKPAGLLFMCYQRNIGQQFEFLQQSWSNNSNFLFGHGTVGLDPVIGQGERVPLTFPAPWQGPGTATASFKQFVTLRGGEYFYAPSVSGLKQLAGSAAPALLAAE